MKRVHLNESDIQNIVKNIVKKFHGKQSLNEGKGNIYLDKLISEAIGSITDTNNTENILKAVVDAYYKNDIYGCMYSDDIEKIVNNGVLEFTFETIYYAEESNTTVEQLPYPFNRDTEVSIKIPFDYDIEIDEPEPEVGYNGGYSVRCTKVFSVSISFADGSEPININCGNGNCSMIYGLVNSFLDEDNVSEYIYESYNNYDPDYEDD